MNEKLEKVIHLREVEKKLFKEIAQIIGVSKEGARQLYGRGVYYRKKNLMQGGEARSSRQAHNLKFAGSNPAPATNSERGYFMEVICCKCEAVMEPKPCIESQAGKISHSYCPECLQVEVNSLTGAKI